MRKLQWICCRCGFKNQLRWLRCRRCRARVSLQRRVELGLLWTGALH